MAIYLYLSIAVVNRVQDMKNFQTKLKFILFFVFLIQTGLVFSQQEDTTALKFQELDDVYVGKNYWKQYNYYLKKARKVYPLALYAAKKLKEIDEEMAQAESKRKKKKVGKEANKDLRAEFAYVVRDLYTSEGQLLMLLIHRETGLTVTQIIEKYRGKFRADLQDNIGKIWDQDLDATYDPKKLWILENVIKDINKGKVEFDFNPKIVSKEEYKEGMKEYRINKKEAKKAMRAKRKSGSEKKE